MKHAEKKTNFRNMFIFIDRIKNVIKMKNAKLFRNNFQISLRNETLKLYTCQLIDNENRLLIYNNNVDK